MKYFSIVTTLMLSALLLASCGGGAGGSLDAKKKELTQLQTEYKEIGKKIRELEKAIEKLDSSTVKDPRIPVAVIAVKTQTFQHFVKVQGQIESDMNIMVVPKTSGTVTKVYVKEGQTVKRGQLLAKVDDAVIQKSISELETQLELADTLYRRQKRLWAQQIGSEVQLLQAKTQRESLKKRIATTQEQLSWSNITAPISGVVDMVITKEGETASPMAPAFQIVNLSDLKFKADISEAYIPHINRGDNVTIYFPAVNATISAKVGTVSQTINPTNRTISIRVDLPGKNPTLKANMIGEISINDLTHENAVVIPREYIQKSSEGSFVMVAKRNEKGEYNAQKVAVKPGTVSNGMIEILSGLNSNQLLITDGAQGLNDGQIVRFDGVSQAK